MCQWYCTSQGPSTNLHCLHCHVRYCGACLHGESGKMESLVKCAGCGRKPRVKSNASRRGWGGEVASPQGTSKSMIRPPQRGKTAAAYWAYKNDANQGQFTWGSPAPKRTIFDKLTDPSLYTGSHKHRFDREGRGRGLEGRESVSKGLGTGAVIRYYGDGPVTSIAQLVRNERLDPQHMNKLRRFPDGSTILSPKNRSWKGEDGRWRPDMPRDVYPANNPHWKRTGTTPGGSPMGSPQSARLLSGSQSARSVGLGAHDIAQLTHSCGGEWADTHSPAASSSFHSVPATQPRPQTAQYVPSPIFDKLTDPALYTGTHRHRFDEQTGEGLGLAGRVEVTPDRYTGDSYASSAVNDLSQITRTQYNVGAPDGKVAPKFLY